MVYVKTGDYNDHFSSNSLEQVIGNILQVSKLFGHYALP